MEPTHSEKNATQQITPSNSSSTTETIDLAAIPQPTSKLQRLANRLEASTGIEARGIERVPEAERERKYAVKDYLYMAMIWFSANCTANQLTVGILGPIAYGLGFVDAMICCLFGTILGSCLTGYISTFGPLSGNRTLVIARYTMGWYPSKICVLLNLVIEIGYGVVDTIVAGLILSAVNGKGMSVIVGIIITAIISWMISTFGIKFFNMFERFIWIPQVCILFIFVGVAAPYFDVDTPSKATGVTLAGNRLSYVFLSASGPLGWSPAAADFYVYFPPKASRWAVFAMTSSGLILGKLFVEFLGIGLGSGLAKNSTWAAAFDNSTGALIVEALGPLGGFGKFLAVVLALGVVANNIPGTYSASLSFQILATWALKIPRIVWSTVAVVVYTVCAIAGRDNLLTIFLNFLALIGYWTIIWITLTMEEEFIFRRKSGYDWAAWNDRNSMPIGIAALSAFLVGWIGAILGMDQTYFVGPIAKLIGGYGSDIGLPLAAAWSGIVYPPLRGLELRYFGR